MILSEHCCTDVLFLWLSYCACLQCSRCGLCDMERTPNQSADHPIRDSGGVDAGRVQVQRHHLHQWGGNGGRQSESSDPVRAAGGDDVLGLQVWAVHLRRFGTVEYYQTADSEGSRCWSTTVLSFKMMWMALQTRGASWTPMRRSVRWFRPVWPTISCSSLGRWTAASKTPMLLRLRGVMWSSRPPQRSAPRNNEVTSTGVT